MVMPVALTVGNSAPLETISHFAPAAAGVPGARPDLVRTRHQAPDQGACRPAEPRHAGACMVSYALTTSPVRAGRRRNLRT
jgi:hypothetical protein